MVQAIENRTALTVRLVAAAPHPRLNGWDLLAVDVLDAQPVPGYADLLARQVGHRLGLAVPSDRVAGLAPGTVIRLRARLAGGEALADKRPEPGTFVIEPPSCPES
ncbi:hypothetical protein [Streptomyces griseoruber]|uniref:Uncharacterized protein n=1 Tax=Streptomyces griseoruber TaxID=1943 RepID=A0A117RD45_9ACTN|nr:hypothetical protein [Streptomyces griseoruber]KUN84211.1 hypothetical protein AQJ64_15730 [Streptomyces griseoruber]